MKTHTVFGLQAGMLWLILDTRTFPAIEFSLWQTVYSILIHTDLIGALVWRAFY